MRTEAAWRKWIAATLPPGNKFAALRRQMKAAFYAGAQWGRVEGVNSAAEALGTFDPVEVDTVTKRRRVVRRRRRPE